MSEPVFREWPKIARLNRNVIVTEKLDGTNAAVGVLEDGTVYAQSRSRIITPAEDNYGFAAYVEKNADALRDLLGEGLHFGEWWGQGIQRGYGLKERRFSLFNTKRWEGLDGTQVPGVWAVPVLYRGLFSTWSIDVALDTLRDHGSVAAPPFSRPEGIVAYHEQGDVMFKATLEHDNVPKALAPAA